METKRCMTRAEEKWVAKMEPKPPVIKRTTDNEIFDAYIACPGCGHEVYAKYTYCPNCGQHIRWE